MGCGKGGVRKGDPLSPQLFNFVAEGLSAILTAACVAGHIYGVVPHLSPGGISHLQYVDDTIILIQYDELAVVNLKFLLMCFGNMSVLKINFHKSEVVVLGQPRVIQDRVGQCLNYKLGFLPMTYLGLPIADRKFTIEQWSFLVQKLADREEPSIGRFLSSGGRLILSNSYLASLPTYAMGLFLLKEGP